MSTQKVVLVHGIFDTPRIFRKMIRFLGARGFEAHALQLRPSTGAKGLDVLAEQLQNYIEVHCEGEEKVHLVGYSMGSIVARYYVQRLDGVQRVQRFISLAGPHNGSRMAYLIPNAACRQMRPGSAFLQSLNADLSALEQVGFVSIWTPWDLSVVPAHSSRLPVGDEIQVSVKLHPLMVRSEQCLVHIARLLAAR